MRKNADQGFNFDEFKIQNLNFNLRLQVFLWVGASMRNGSIVIKIFNNDKIQ